MSRLFYAVSRCSPVYAMLFGVLSVCLLRLKRNRLILRISLSAIGFFLLSLLILLIPEDTLYLEAGYYYLLYLTIGAVLLICFEGTVYEAAYICVIGELWQHTLYTIWEIIRLCAVLSGRPIDVTSLHVTLGVTILYAGAYMLMFVLLKKYYRGLVPLNGYREILIAGLLIPVPLVMMNLWIMRLTAVPLHLLAYRVYTLLMCVICYLMMVSVQRNKVARLEMQSIREAAERQKEQYEFKKEVIERVNIRAHDLKRQLDYWEAAGQDQKSVISCIRRELALYESLAETGNKTLDTILSDAIMRSRQLQIRFSYLVDGKELAFVETIDLYAIFGNLLDNAFTAASQISDPERRIVSLKMRDTGDCLYFHLFNTCESTPEFENGLPKTTRPDAENHGFGTKSVRASVQRYGGEVLITAKDGLFNVDFFLRKP